MNVSLQRFSHVLVAAGKLALLALLAWFIYQALVSGNEALDAYRWHVDPAWLITSGGLYLLGMFFQSLFWQRVLASTGQEVPTTQAVRAYFISQLGKYVPGKWMVIVLRRALLTAPGLENTVVAASVFYETFTLLSVGAVLAAVLLVVWQPHQVLLIAVAAGSGLLLGVPIVPAVFGRLMQLLKVDRLNSTASARFGRIEWREILAGWMLVSIGWVLQGMSFWATLRAMGATDSGPIHDLALHTATVALSIVAGFLSQIPGGLVVREWVSLQLVEPHYGAAVSAVSVIIFRLVLLVAELLSALVLYVALWRRASGAGALARTELTAAAGRMSHAPRA